MRALILILLIGSAKAQRLDYNTVCHFGVGMGVGNAVSVFGKNPEHRVFIGLASGFVAGMGKEIYDANRGQTAQFTDILATAIGGATSAMITNLIIKRHANIKKHCQPKAQARIRKRRILHDVRNQ